MPSDRGGALVPDRPPRRWCRPASRSSERGRKPSLDLRQPEDLAPVEGIDDQFAFIERDLAEEMARERDSVDTQPAAAADFHVDDGERDGDAGAALDHFVQEAVL